MLAERPLRRRQDQERHLDFWKKELGGVFLGDVTPSLIAEKRDKLSRGNRSGGARRAAATVNRLRSDQAPFVFRRSSW